MKHIRRAAGLLLAGSLLLGLLSGCQASAGSDVRDAGPDPVTPVQAPNDPVPPTPELVIDMIGPDVTFPQYALFHCDQPHFRKGPDAPSDWNDAEAVDLYYTQLKSYESYLAGFRKNADFETLMPRYLDFVGRAAPYAAGTQDEGNPNFVYSPLSLYSAMCSLSGALSGDDRAAVLDFLGLDDIEMAKSAAYTMYRGLSFNINSESLGLANSVWFREDLVPPPHEKNSAAERLCEDFFASAYSVPFGTDEADQAVSQWINEKTNGVIRLDFKSTEELAMAVINALYYKDSWTDSFDTALTDKSDFTAPGGLVVPVDMMHRSDTGDYFRNDVFTMASVPANHGEVRFILPNDEDADIKALMSDPDVISRACAADSYDKNAMIHWSVPRFDVTSDLILTDALGSMGLGVIGKTLDMSELLGRSDISISSVIQQAHVDADEDGFEAAAVTIVMVTDGLSPFDEDTPELDMDLDRPFGFVIMSQDMPLFVGYVSNPIA